MCIGGRLCSGDKPVPLVGTSVDAKLIDFVAEVSISQRYQNVEEGSIEALYEFPLAEGAAVYKFFAIVNGKRIEGKNIDKEKAIDQYDDAIAAGHSAYLLKRGKRENIFKINIGNLLPKEEVVVTIVYVTELNFADDRKLLFTIPSNTSVYPDGNEKLGFKQSTNPPTDNPTPPFGLKIEVALEMTSKIRAVTSPSHPIEYTVGSTPNLAKVILANTTNVGEPLASNFELQIALENPDQPVFRVQDGVGMLALYPNLADDEVDPISELIFVVDRSGSMEGSKIESAKNALLIFLHSLPLGTLFNIIGFGSTHTSLFPDGSQEYNDDTLALATKLVKEMHADLGGTALLQPLKYILRQKPRTGIPRQLFVLTDGEVDNTDECIAFVREHSDTTRLFAFGIEGASPDLVNGIAKAGEGQAELIGHGENVESKVMAQLQRALKPALTDLQIDWGTLAAEQTPFKLPPLFSGSRIIVYGYLPVNAKPGKVVFTANSAKGRINVEHCVTAEDLKPFAGSSFIPRLAARSLIRDLEEGRSAAQFIQQLTTQQVKQKIIDLSVASGVLSKYTAFIAFNENNTPLQSSMDIRQVNKNLKRKAPQQRGVVQTKSMCLPMSKGALLTNSSLQPALIDENEDEECEEDISSDLDDDEDEDYQEDLTIYGMAGSIDLTGIIKYGATELFAPVPAPITAPEPKRLTAMDIVTQQRAAGNFTEEALNLLGNSLAKLRSLAPLEQFKLVPTGLLDQILITLYMCGVLRTKYSSEAEQWAMVDKKAIAWIKREAKKHDVALADFDWNSLVTTLAQ